MNLVTSLPTVSLGLVGGCLVNDEANVMLGRGMNLGGFALGSIDSDGKEDEEFSSSEELIIALTERGVSLEGWRWIEWSSGFNVLQAANLVALGLGHGHATDPEDLHGYLTLEDLRDVWLATGRAHNGGLDCLFGMEGWMQEVSPQGALSALTHTTPSGRLTVRLANGWDGLRPETLFITIEAGGDYSGATVAEVALRADGNVRVKVNSRLLEGRADRVDLLHRIDRTYTYRRREDGTYQYVSFRGWLRERLAQSEDEGAATLLKIFADMDAAYEAARAQREEGN